jgi:transcriptional/translational regulatory protein YebC/TACO1
LIFYGITVYGPDPATNPRLKTTIADAKRQSLPKEVLESAIKRGQGLSTSGKPLENITMEALFPGGIAAIIECATESKARTLMEVRTILSKNGGSQGVVEYLFKRRGVVRIHTAETSPGDEESGVVDKLMDIQGVEDFEEVESESESESESQDAGGETWEMYCSSTAVKSVADAAEKVAGVEIKGMEILWQPVDYVEAGEDDAAVVERCVEKLEELTEVRQVYLNMVR